MGQRAALVIVGWLVGGCAPQRPQPIPGPRSPVETPTAALSRALADTLWRFAHVGVLLVPLGDTAALACHQAERLFVPASNAKLFTGAAVLETLGPAYRFRTEAWAGGRVRHGVLEGDLIVRGYGDPSWSPNAGLEPFARLAAWADSLRHRGIERIRGRLVADASAFADDPVPPGWTVDDLVWAYGAPVPALFFHDGMATLTVRAGASGDTAHLRVTPEFGVLHLRNRTRTDPAAREAAIELRRALGRDTLVVTGVVPLDTVTRTWRVALPDPALAFVAALQRALASRGVAVEGGLAVLDASSSTPVGPLLFVDRSPPLAGLLGRMLKPSQNQWAELFLRTLGLELRGEGSTAAGLAVLDSLARAWGLPFEERRQTDGSGLSRANLVSPRFLVALLQRMARSAYADLWRRSLPVAGVDGTLASRLRGTLAEGRVVAKTGTLGNVRALSGYLERPDGRPWVFAILINHHGRTTAAVDRIVDALLLAWLTAPAEPDTGAEATAGAPTRRDGWVDSSAAKARACGNEWSIWR